MCLFGHDWKLIKSDDVELMNGKECLAVLEECEDCGKERGYVINNVNEKKTYAVWYIKRALGLSYKEVLLVR